MGNVGGSIVGTREIGFFVSPGAAKGSKVVGSGVVGGGLGAVSGSSGGRIGLGSGNGSGVGLGAGSLGAGGVGTGGANGSGLRKGGVGGVEEGTSGFSGELGVPDVDSLGSSVTAGVGGATEGDVGRTSFALSIPFSKSWTGSPFSNLISEVFLPLSSHSEQIPCSLSSCQL